MPLVSTHVWARQWPGNFCLRCRADDPFEQALVCADCVTPGGQEDPQQEVILCERHKAVLYAPCKIRRQ